MEDYRRPHSVRYTEGAGKRGRLSVETEELLEAEHLESSEHLVSE